MRSFAGLPALPVAIRTLPFAVAFSAYVYLPSTVWLPFAAPVAVTLRVTLHTRLIRSTVRYARLPVYRLPFPFTVYRCGSRVLYMVAGCAVWFTVAVGYTFGLPFARLPRSHCAATHSCALHCHTVPGYVYYRSYRPLRY